MDKGGRRAGPTSLRQGQGQGDRPCWASQLRQAMRAWRARAWTRELSRRPRGWLLASLMGGLISCASGTTAAAALEGQQFDETTILSDQTLRLNGLGLRGVAWIRAFVVGLYLAAPTKDSIQVLTMPGPKRLRLKIMLSAPSHELTKSLTSRISRNELPSLQQHVAADLGVLAQQIDALGELKEGDTLDLDYVPQRGIQLRLNEQSAGMPVDSDDLYRAVLKIFVGERPVDARLKEGLLRGGF